MHLAARALVLALLPSVAAAQVETRYPATQQATPSAAQAAVSTGAAARYLVIACPSASADSPASSVLPSEPADSTARQLAAVLCTRAQGPSALQQGAPLSSTAAERAPEQSEDAPEPAIALLMRLAESPAGTPPSVRPARERGPQPGLRPDYRR